MIVKSWQIKQLKTAADFTKRYITLMMQTYYQISNYVSPLLINCNYLTMSLETIWIVDFAAGYCEFISPQWAVPLHWSETSSVSQPTAALYTCRQTHLVSVWPCNGWEGWWFTSHMKLLLPQKSCFSTFFVLLLRVKERTFGLKVQIQHCVTGYFTAD